MVSASLRREVLWGGLVRESRYAGYRVLWHHSDRCWLKVQAQELIRALIESYRNLRSEVTFHALQDGVISFGDQKFSAMYGYLLGWFCRGLFLKCCFISLTHAYYGSRFLLSTETEIWKSCILSLHWKTDYMQQIKSEWMSRWLLPMPISLIELRISLISYGDLE